MNNHSCAFIDKGLFVSHRGSNLCCVNENPIKEIQLPSKFWNGSVRRNAIKNVQKNLPVNGCDYCYRSETQGLSSNRLHYKKYENLETKTLPVILDLDFSNFCNLKCVMCSADRSSEWAKEDKIYQETNNISSVSKDIIDDLINISKDVKEIQIQGGEPTIMDQYQYYFNMLNSKNYSKNINLLITTNATNINQRFYKSLQNFKSVRMSVSIDAFGQANDYIRWPSKFKSIEKNIRSMVNYENFSQVEIFNTINILSMFNYKEFLLWCKDIESFYKEQQKNLVIIPWKVEKPIWYSPFIANNNLKEHFISEVRAFLQKNTLSSQNWKTPMLLFLKALNKSIANDSANKQFLYKIKHLDKQRNTKIQDFIPNFYDFYEKSQ